MEGHCTASVQQDRDNRPMSPGQRGRGSFTPRAVGYLTCTRHNLYSSCTVVLIVFNRRSPTVKTLNLLAAVLLIVGGLNWGLVALAEFDLVAWITGQEFGETN